MRVRTIWEMGLRIRDRRLELGWSQAQLADRLGTTRQWVNSLEQGNPGAALGQVLQAIEVLGLRLDVRDRRRKGAEAPSRRSREMSDDEFYSYLDEVVRRAREPEDDTSDPEPGGSGTSTPEPPLDPLPPRTPLRRRKEE